jgi:hypothetical protein
VLLARTTLLMLFLSPLNPDHLAHSLSGYEPLRNELARLVYIAAAQTPRHNASNFLCSALWGLNNANNKSWRPPPHHAASALSVGRDEPVNLDPASDYSSEEPIVVSTEIRSVQCPQPFPWLAWRLSSVL